MEVTGHASAFRSSDWRTHAPTSIGRKRTAQSWGNLETRVRKRLNRALLNDSFSSLQNRNKQVYGDSKTQWVRDIGARFGLTLADRRGPNFVNEIGPVLYLRQSG